MRPLVFFIAILSIQLGIAQSDIQTIGQLPSSLAESSGLIYYNGSLVTHNDSGNAPELYEIDKATLQIIRTIRVLNTENIDWEDLAQDNEYIYIGDIGNNLGNRRDLGILKIRKSEYDTSNEVHAERIAFEYEDQFSFDVNQNSDFDAEALVAMDNDFIIFTKQWQSQGTVAYRIPKGTDTALAQRVGEYPINGLVTGAAFNVTTNTIYLVGYSSFLFPFFVEILSADSANFFQEEFTKSALDIGAAQVEAITIVEDDFFISCEEFISPPFVNSLSRLLRFSLDETIDDNQNEEPNVIDGEVETSIKELVVFKQPGSNQLEYTLNTDKPIFGMAIFDLNGRMVDYVPLELISKAPLDISNLTTGLYYLAFFHSNEVLVSSFFKD